VGGFQQIALMSHQKKASIRRPALPLNKISSHTSHRSNAPALPTRAGGTVEVLFWNGGYALARTMYHHSIFYEGVPHSELTKRRSLVRP
jgi:hypothetical protein